MHVSFNATAALPLTDANDAYANAYQLAQLKLELPLRTER